MRKKTITVRLFANNPNNTVYSTLFADDVMEAQKIVAERLKEPLLLLYYQTNPRGVLTILTSSITAFYCTLSDFLPEGLDLYTFETWEEYGNLR